MRISKNIVCLAVILLSLLPHIMYATDVVDYVNPLIGTQSTFELSAGNTYPAIARPWGMNFWTPQTGAMGNGWQYKYTDTKICGFKQTHQPSPWINDYGQFSLMPVSGGIKISERERCSWFSHKAEIVRPYYYSVYLAEHDIVTEITPTERAAMFRFTFPEDSAASVVIDAFDSGSYIKVLPDQKRIVGYTTRNSGGVPANFRNYFVIEFDKTFASAATFISEKGEKTYSLQKDNLECNGWHTGAVVCFKTARGEKIHARVASSFISPEQALQNLNELDNNNFDTIAHEGRDAWNKTLGRIIVDGGTVDQYRTFYSCLYRSLLFPRKFYEISPDGKVIHYSPYNGEIKSGYMYTDTGFWDTFRALFPLLNLVYPSENAKIQEGLINTYHESGFFPEWASPGHRNCMVGNNSAAVLADSWLKGIHVADTTTLWQGIVNGCNNVHQSVSSTGRLGHEYYNTLGYVPCDVGINESAARTLEYAYNDWAIYKLARALKRPESEQQIYARRAMNYKNLFDSKTCLMRGKKADGTFAEPFSPLKWGDAFTEGNSWHYTWSVFHDPQGLINLMGGDDKFVAMMDSVFTVPPLFDDSYYGFPIHEIREMQVMNMGNYAHGNQPVQHMIYLYNWAGQPWKAQKRVRMVMNQMYTPTPDGYCGDEDNGQTSAWYVFSAMGFYPVAPGSGEYASGSPLFKKITINLENGKYIKIEAPDNSYENCYITQMTVNGIEYDKTYLNHDVLMNGAHIKIKMSATADTIRGTDKSSRPYSFSNENL